MGTQPPSAKRRGATSPILMVEVENFEIEPEVVHVALPVIANFVVLEEQIIWVKTRSESV